MLATLSVTVTVSGVVAVLFAHATLAVSQFGTVAGVSSAGRFAVGFISRSSQDDKVLLVVAVMLAALAVVNILFITRSAIRDGSRVLAISRALGATPEQLGLRSPQARSDQRPPVRTSGSPTGASFSIANQGGASSQPPAWWPAAVVFAAVALVTLLTAAPARLGARAPIAEQLHARPDRSAPRTGVRGLRRARRATLRLRAEAQIGSTV